MIPGVPRARRGRRPAEVRVVSPRAWTAGRVVGRALFVALAGAAAAGALDVVRCAL